MAPITRKRSRKSQNKSSSTPPTLNPKRIKRTPIRYVSDDEDTDSDEDDEYEASFIDDDDYARDYTDSEKEYEPSSDENEDNVSSSSRTLRQRQDASNGKKDSNPEPKKKKEKDLLIYKKLVKGLEPYATRPGLEPLEIIMEFEWIGSDTDSSQKESCICGKQKIVYLFYLRNLKKEDLIDRATSTVIVGSECINTFNKAKNASSKLWKGKLAIENEFVKWSQKGICGQFETKRKAGKLFELWTISFTSSKLLSPFKPKLRRIDYPNHFAFQKTLPLTLMDSIKPTKHS